MDLIPSINDFYLIQLSNPTDCTIHPMVIIDKRDNTYLVSIGTEVTLDYKTDEKLLLDLIKNAPISDETELEFYWIISNDIIDNVNRNAIIIDNSYKFDMTFFNVEVEPIPIQCEIISKWDLNSYKETF